MRINNKNNFNNIGFGRVFMNVMPREGSAEKCLAACNSLKKSLLKSKTNSVINARPYYKDRTFETLSEYDFAVDCQEDGDFRFKEISVPLEKKLVQRFKNWAIKNGFDATITRYNGDNLEEKLRVQK